MRNENECNVIKDLLPSYIDNLTSIESNELINKHLKECDSCKKFLNNIKNEEVKEEKETEFLKFAKKYNKKLFNLRMILIFIILIGFSIFTISTGRKMIIISNLSNKAKKYESSDNYHMILYNNEKDKLYQLELYKMGDKLKTISICMQNNKFEKIVSIGHKNVEKSKEIQMQGPDDNIYDMHTYYDEIPELGNRKIAVIDSDKAIANKIHNALYTDNLWELFKFAINSSVKNTTIYGKEFYHITCDERFCTEGLYFDKETGIYMSQRAETGQDKKIFGLSETIYEFNTVTESDFIEPDISEYESITTEEYYNILYNNK